MIQSLLESLALAYFHGNVASFSWMQLLPGVEELGHALHLADPHEAFFIPSTWLIVFVILGAAVLARLGLNAALARQGTDKFLPDAGLTVRNIFEMMVEWLSGLFTANAGEKEMRAFFPLVGSLFVYIFVANFSGFIPGFLPPTDNMSSNFAMALVVFLVFNYAGLSRNGFGYIKHLAGPVVALAPVFLVLESISLLIRPMSLSIRLTVNIFVDHLLQSIARDLGGIAGALGSVILPVPLYFLGTIVCAIQAFVFALLTVIYISQATAHEEHGDGHDHAH